MAALAPPVLYRVDEFDRLGWMNAAWRQFALANDGEALASPSIVGRDLWELMGADPTTVFLYALLLERVRASCRPLSFPFRCDAPRERRLMRMAVTGWPRGDVEFRVDTIETSSRVPVALFEAGAVRCGDVADVCPICARVSTGPSRWCEVEEAARERRSLLGPFPPVRGQVFCPRCLDEFTAALQRDDSGPFGTAAL